MDVRSLLVPQGLGENGAHATAASAYTLPPLVATSMQSGPVFPTIHRELYAEPPVSAPQGSPSSQPSVAPGQDDPVAIDLAGQSNIKIITIRDLKGRDIVIPVDSGVASRNVDEKRKRNASALARFRARRKDRGARLTYQQVLDNMKHFKFERDYYRSIVLQQPHAEQHYARPPTPHRRLSITPSTAPSSDTGADSVGSPYSESLNSPGPPVTFLFANVPNAPSAARPPPQPFNQRQLPAITPPSHNISSAGHSCRVTSPPSHFRW